MGPGVTSHQSGTVDALKAKIKTTLADQEWRLNNLYHIEDKEGCAIPFRMNRSQKRFYRAMANRNVILKARQLGFSTLIALLFLDVCVFNRNVSAGIVDHTIEDGKAKLGKAKFAYERLPDWIKQSNPLISENVFELKWGNGSSLDVGVSHRGGTKQYLHVSEMGKTAVKFPEKAREIITGAFNAVPPNGVIIVESTAEGQSGSFFSMCQRAMTKTELGSKMTRLDFKFHFFPWHQAPEYIIRSDQPIETPPHLSKYFDDLQASEDVSLTREQRAWYVKMAEEMQDDMKREYPSTPKEAFEASIQGAIFGPHMEAVKRRGGIGLFPAHSGVPVHTFWDIGRKDYNSIWFAQVFAGKVRIVGFYQSCLESMPHYAAYCFGSAVAEKHFPTYAYRERFEKGVFEKNGWARGIDVFPHDGRVEEWGSGRTRLEQLVDVGFMPKLATAMSKHDSINAARATIGVCEFDREGCGDGREWGGNGLRILREYRWKWDVARGMFLTNEPDHNDASHGADAFRYLASTWRELPTQLEPKKPMPHSGAFEIEAKADGSVSLGATFEQMIEARKRKQRLQSARLK